MPLGRRGAAVAYRPYTANEMMTIAAARALSNDDVCFVGIGLPSTACNLARLTHAPGITLIYESGTIATRPNVLPLSIGDGELCETALTTVSVPEMFRYWLQGGRISVGFLGGAQIDRFGNINSTVIGDYAHQRCACPAPAARPEIASACGQIFVVMPQTPRAFVDGWTSSPRSGTARGATTAPGAACRRTHPGDDDLCVMEPDPASKELHAHRDRRGRDARAGERGLPAGRCVSPPRTATAPPRAWRRCCAICKPARPPRMASRTRARLPQSR